MNFPKFFIRRLLTGCAIASSLGISALNAKGQDNQISRNRVFVDRILSDPLYMKLDGTRISWQENEFGTFNLPAEGYEHPEGIFQMFDISMLPPIGSLPASYSVSIFGQSRFRVVDFEHIHSMDNCQQRGREFLKRQFPWFFELGPDPEVKIQEPIWNSPHRKGVWSFHWFQRDSEGLPFARADVMVRAADGRVVGFSARTTKWVQHKALYRDVEPTAIRLAAQEQSVKNVVVTSSSVFASKNLFGDTNLPKVVFEINLSAVDKKTMNGRIATVILDGDTGQPVWINPSTGKSAPSKVEWHPSPSDAINDQPMEVLATSPIWINSGLSFISRVPATGTPKGVSALPQLVFTTQNGGVVRLTQDLEVGVDEISSLPSSSWIIVGRRGWTYAINIKDADYRVLGTPERGAFETTVSLDGRWAVVSAVGHERRDDVDLFADDLDRGADLQLRSRLVLPGSDEHHPLFSPDNQWLYFISTKKDKATGSLCRIAASVAHIKELVHLRPEQVETVVPMLPEGVQRLSFYPSGQKLLLQGKTKIFVLDVKGHKATAVPLPQLQDGDLGNVAIIKLEGGWAGPGEDEVTFSGETTDAAKVVRRRVYSCGLDGKNLKALTPKDNTPVNAFQFEQGKKNATDLAKEWALSEIKWQEAHQDQ